MVFQDVSDKPLQTKNNVPVCSTTRNGWRQAVRGSTRHRRKPHKNGRNSRSRVERDLWIWYLKFGRMSTGISTATGSAPARLAPDPPCPVHQGHAYCMKLHEEVWEMW